MEHPILRSYFRYSLYAILLFILSWLFSGCNSADPSLKATLTPSPGLTSTLAPSPTSTPTTTPMPPMAILLSPAGADQPYANLLQAKLSDITTRTGLHLQVRQQLAPADLTSNVRLVVALPPDPGISGLAVAAPDTMFLAIGIPGLEASPNLSVINSDDQHPDQQGFIAGVIAAMLSSDWRLGVISISDTIPGRAARTGFLNGVEYFCGLCRPAHPPFYEYPLYIELPATATSTEWQEAANYMADHNALTVYVAPGAGDDSMLATLANDGINIISHEIPPDSIRSNWVVSLASDPWPLIQSQVEGLLDGTIMVGQSLAVPLQFTQINPGLFTPGKQRLAQQILSDLQAGYIDTAVDMTTGENRP